MKTFINVLYRRILYKIPLKRLLVGLAVFSVLLASFSSADNTIEIGHVYYPNNFNFRLGDVYNTQIDVTPVNPGMTCINLNGDAQGNFEWHIGNDVITFSSWDTYCTNSTANMYITSDFYTHYYWYYFSNTVIELFKPNYTSLQCQTEYNLIPISSVDSNYCTTNNLCPSQECPDIPIGTGNLTQLYINNILHVGAPTILMNVPDEIDWDYAYTQGGNIMNIDIVGYNVDYQVVEDEITIQKYKPSTEELSGIISGLIPLFVPGLCIILLLYFIFKFIKKVF